jgi:hypothetical protein
MVPLSVMVRILAARKGCTLKAVIPVVNVISFTPVIPSKHRKH